jgi:hypothetical protein
MTRKQFILLLCLAFLLRLPMMVVPLWYDENFTLLMARLPLSRMMEAAIGDVHPPLFYLINWLLYRLPGLPVWAIRLPSLICSMLCLPVLREILIQRKASPRLQTITLVLMAMAPQQIYYASEGRMYALLCLLVLLGYLFVLQRRWVLIAVTVGAMALTHNYGLFYGFTLGLVAIWQDRRDWMQIGSSFGAAALCWLPWVAVMRVQVAAIDRTFWITYVSLAQGLLMFYQQIWSLMLLEDVLTLTITFTWLLLGIYLLRRDAPVLLMALMPTALALAISFIWQPILLFRAVIGSAPFLYMLCAAVLEKACLQKSIRPALLAAILLLPMVVMSYKNMYRNPYRVNFTNTLAVIEANRLPGDVIATSSDSIVDLLPYTDMPIISVPACRDNKGALTKRTRAALGYNFQRWQDIQAKRIWLINWLTPFMYQCAIDEDQAWASGGREYFTNSPSALSTTSLYLIER